MIVLDAYPEPPSPPSISVSRVVVALRGELDLAASRALGVLHEAVEEHAGAHVLVDLSGVTFLDHTALVAFARARSRAEARGGQLSLHGASPFAARLLQIWHLEPGCGLVSVPDDAA